MSTATISLPTRPATMRSRRPIRSRPASASRRTTSATMRFGPMAFAIRSAPASTASTGDLWIGDVGQGGPRGNRLSTGRSATGGENYGWRLREGTNRHAAGGVGGTARRLARRARLRLRSRHATRSAARSSPAAMSIADPILRCRASTFSWTRGTRRRRPTTTIGCSIRRIRSVR